jgi:drug/metabolite transporter (DMT)-like permease
MMLVLLSVIFLKQKLYIIDAIAILISFSGVIIISSQGTLPFSGKMNEPVGVLLAVGSSIIWASYWIINIKDKRPELDKIALNFFFGAIFATIYLLIFDELPLINKSWIPALYIGLTEMALAFVFWLTALANTTNNARISNMVFISPFLALIFIHLILDEKIYLTTPIGLAFIVGGIIFQQLNRKKEA